VERLFHQPHAMRVEFKRIEYRAALRGYSGEERRLAPRSSTHVKPRSVRTYQGGSDERESCQL
jgi:hypothetical protein